jgi:hypothetical protein
VQNYSLFLELVSVREFTTKVNTTDKSGATPGRFYIFCSY